MSARLYGLGLGPGDPELLTLKARRILAAVDVVAYPAANGGPSLARAIAAPHIAPGRREIAIDLPMRVDPAEARKAYDAGAAAIAAELAQGRSVAVLCEGDPFLYGSFMPIFERLGADHPTEIVPGVSSVMAAAAAAHRPLAARNESLSLIPAPLDDAALAARLGQADAFAILKPGRHFARVKALLARLGLLDACTYVERASQPDERVLPLRETGETAPYFALILGRRPPATAVAGDAEKPALVLLAPSELAARLKGPLGAEIHGFAPRVAAADRTFADPGAHLRALYAQGRPIVAVMAAGALVRLLAPALGDKRAEPPVVALAEDGSVAVPLLGGHRGANDLARRIAALTGGTAAVTTAGDLRFGLALDAPPPGWRLDRPTEAKGAMAALLSGAAARLEGEADWLAGSRLPLASDGTVPIVVSASAGAAAPGGLLYRPATLALGIGAERGAPPEAAIALAEAVLAEARVSPLSLAGVFSLDLKADEPAVHAVAAHFAVPARFYPAAALEAERGRLATPSALVFAETGCHGVAEGAALAAAGPSGRLLVAKRKGERVTAALAQAPRPIDPASAGRARGRLFVVGIGPGSAEWRSPAVSRMVEAADDLVGYSLYLDLLGDLAAGKRRHDFDLGAEETRVRHAMALAGTGRSVALVCSGDAGIYAMATLVFELLDVGGLGDGARRIAIEVSPGISALQAAAARAGAPLGHDFCTISLSDLLTPWSAIERRVRAAAEGDFVIAFYNPVSKRRRTQLAFARDTLLKHRPADTPVVVAANLGRPGERLAIVPLAELDVERVDMLTVVIVGSSQSRTVRTGDGRLWAYTPRGYAEKHGAGLAKVEREGRGT